MTGENNKVKKKSTPLSQIVGWINFSICPPILFYSELFSML